jgi:hypothetical protein
VWPDAESPPDEAIAEGGDYVFELCGIDDPFQVSLTVYREEVEPLRPADDLSAARWAWSTGFHAGMVDIDIGLENGETVSTQLVTSPDLRKITRDRFNRMIRDILQDTFALFRLSGFKAGIARGQGTTAPPISRLEFLRSRMEDLEEAVRQIARKPVQVLQGEQRSVPSHRASSVTGAELARSFRTEEIRAEPPESNRLRSRFQGQFPRRIHKTTQSSGLDIREHQDIKQSLKGWSRWLDVVADRLEDEASSEQESAYHESLRCRRLSERLRDLLRLSLFDRVTDRPSPVRITSIYRRIPAYRSFFRIHNDLNLGIARITGDFLDVPLARTFDLYELWCFLRLLRAAASRLDGEDVDVRPIFDFDPDTGSVTVAASRSEVAIGNGITLCFKRQYHEYWMSQTGRGSFSRNMEPDLSLSIVEDEEEGGAASEAEKGNGPEQKSSESTGTLIVLDAKYRIDSGLNDAIASIHTYRDAIVEEHGGDLPRSVDGAYLLSPLNVADPDSNWQEEDMPDRLFHPIYRGSFRFGAVTLRPGMSLEDIKETLSTILQDTRNDDMASEGNP